MGRAAGEAVDCGCASLILGGGIGGGVCVAVESCGCEKAGRDVVCWRGRGVSRRYRREMSVRGFRGDYCLSGVCRSKIIGLHLSTSGLIDHVGDKHVLNDAEDIRLPQK